jgi:hypothetical protein
MNRFNNCCALFFKPITLHFYVTLCYDVFTNGQYRYGRIDGWMIPWDAILQLTVVR